MVIYIYLYVSLSHTPYPHFESCAYMFMGLATSVILVINSNLTGPMSPEAVFFW